MADFPALFSPGADEFTYTIGTVSPNGVLSGGGMAQSAWPSANLAIYCPIRVARRVIMYKIVVGCGTGAGGNFDVGIFTWSGVKLGSSGSTARVATDNVVCDITDITFGPGRFWFGMSANGVETYSAWWSGLNAGLGKAYGLRQQATAFALPSTATFATSAQSFMPSHLRNPAERVMGDFPTPVWPPFNTISVFSLESLGGVMRAADMVALSNATTSRTQTANTAYYYPFRLWETATAYKMTYFVGATANGNVDLGIYDSQKNRLVNSGTVAQGTTSTIQEVDIADTVLKPGIYFMAIQFSSGTATALGSSNVDETFQVTLPAWQQAVGSFGLPNPATWINSTQGTIEYHILNVHFDATI